MKYTVCGFQQDILVKYKFDSSDANILRWIIDFYTTGKMCHKIIDHRIYFWVNYKSIMEALPILGISNPEMIARRFTKWEKVGLIKKLIVKGKDEFSINGRAGKRNGTFTYFSFDMEKMTVLMGGLPESRALCEPSDLEVEQGSTVESDGGLPKGRTKDSSIINTSNKNNSNTAQKVIFSNGGWEFYENETARYTDDPVLYSWDRMPISLPIEIMKIQDDRRGKVKRPVKTP